MKIWRFAPLLFLYVLVIFLASSRTFWHDEIRYVHYAENLTHGYYSPPGQIHLKNGPGYPLILAPFALLHLPYHAARFLNAVLLFAAVIYFYLTATLYISDQKKVYWLSLLFGLYPPFLRYLPLLITEITSVFLVTGFLYHSTRSLLKERPEPLHVFLASLFLSFLALTKVLFGYVIPIMLLIALLVFMRKRSLQRRRNVVIYLLAFFFCLPYLIYTYHLTGRPFYWATVGGMSLYWMSSPYAGDLGDWNSEEKVRDVSQLAKNHLVFFKEIENLNELDRDHEFKEKALQNIRSHPIKFIRNWFANIGRLLFNYPYSYTQQKLDTYLYIIPNAFLFVFAILAIRPLWLERKTIPFPLVNAFLFAFIGLAGLSLLSAYGRFLLPFIPIILIMIGLFSMNVPGGRLAI